ncbi:adenylate isopentenyltransferase-like [Phalaenopsis equestris]|uniref:adenylate isopentenyltransferase-like n=1 Tax=Phalaenopsis equestris TaxID=78828 RepID=UPI0009E61271|nr:adenylate isopentenyltransferase-like [Phalaenopsis equestris]
MRILFSRGSGTARSAAAVAGNGFQCARKEREGVVVIMGATGTGKSKLSIDIASQFRGEVVNADKIQVYRGLDITTNKMPLEERRGVPHHLLGELDPLAGELPPAAFRTMARAAVANIASRGRVPVVAGGSNSYIHAMMVDRYDERENPFVGTSVARHWLRYRSCLLWVDVETAVLAEHLDRRVDEMVGMGMVEELGRYFARTAAEERHPGLGKAIGVPEFKEYFRRGTVAAYEEALAAIKENTRRLAAQQVRKIVRLGELGWPMKRLDASPVVEARLAGAGREAEVEAWERGVLGPSLRAVERFLQEDLGRQRLHPPF